MSWVLAAASGGLDILGGYLNGRAGARAAGQQTFALTMAGSMERMQLRAAAKDDTRLRAMELQQVLGAQRAAFGQRGIAGGRSAQLLQTTSRVAAMREQEVSDRETRMQIEASQFRQRTGVASARAEGRQAGLQGLFDMAGGGISVFRGIQTERDRRAVLTTGGP